MTSATTIQLTYKFRLRDKHASELNRQARAVSLVWNFCNETQRKAVCSGRKWLGAGDLMRLTAGASRHLEIHAHTIQRVCRQYDVSRAATRKPWLRWRGRKSLGWVPYNTGHVTFDGQAFQFRGARYEPMHLRDLPCGVKIAAGTFNADRKGRWYINVTVDVAVSDRVDSAHVGVDLGLRDLVLSDGRKVEIPRFYRQSEAALATAQRAKKTKRARAIHQKIANRRSDFIHKLSAQIARDYALIVVGDVSPSKLAKTNMAKSVLDAGWSDLRSKLLYKSIRNGGNCIEVCERNTSGDCSSCNARSGPKGLKDLRIRAWTCGECGAVHDRDVNAARNILARGLASLAEGARS